MITLDVETYSAAGYIWSSLKSYTASGKEKPGWIAVKKGQKSGIEAVGAWCYAEHPTTEMLSLDYDGVLWVPGMAPPAPLLQHIADGGLIEAQNSFFEFVIWHFVCHLKLGWPPLPLANLRCTMSRSMAHGLPGKLEKAAIILDLPTQKDTDGGKIMKKLSKPRDPTLKDKRTRYTPADSPDEFLKLYQYNSTDTAAEKDLSAAVPQLSDFELALWQLDQRINVRGVACDIEAIRGGRKIMAALEAEKEAEIAELTNGMVTTGGQRDRIIDFCNLHGVHLPDLQKETVAEALLRPDLPDVPRKCLELRQALSMASVKKLAAMENRYANDGRLHDMFSYCGAQRTGRWSSEAAQLHNLSKKGPSVSRCTCGAIAHSSVIFCPDICGGRAGGAVAHLLAAWHPAEWNIDAVEQCLVDIRAGDINRLRARWGSDVALAISGCLRGMLTSGPGMDFIGTDYDQIEARVLAILAGEQWRIAIFEAGGSTYETTAAGISGVPLDEILQHKIDTGNHHPHRNPYGKVPDLACGFQGAVGAFLRFGADAFMTHEAIEAAVKKWRGDNPMIVKLWYALEDAAVAACMSPGVRQVYRMLSYYYDPAADVLYCTLPSGRNLSYHAPRLSPHDWKTGAYSISYMGVVKGAWLRIDGYGGMFAENVTQATARDYMAYGMLQLEDGHGYPIALHVHDEPVVEVPEGVGTIEDVERILALRPPWAHDWPITASGGWRGKRFRKD